MEKASNFRDVSIPKEWDRKGLPSWTYKSKQLLEIEKESLFFNHWQLICHQSDLSSVGDFLTFDLCNERILIIRDNENIIRAFYNLCRHRGSRVMANEKGNCTAIVCPFHGWVYNLDGTLRGASQPKSFPKFNKKDFGLKKIECEIWNGLVFIRLNKGPQKSVKSLMSPFSEELGNYKIDKMVPTDGIWTQRTEVNWKSVRDVDNEGYHVPMAHPSLQDLYGKNYFDEPFVNGISKTHASFSGKTARNWSVKNYKRFSSPASHLPDKYKNSWNYFGIFPNAVIAVTPETVQFYQEFPISTDLTLLRGSIYRHKNETRQQRVARYLSNRIDNHTVAEDVQLTIWSNESMNSKSFEGFYLSDLEYGVKSHHDHMRRQIPILKIEKQPDEHLIYKLNKQMLENISLK